MNDKTAEQTVLLDNCKAFYEAQDFAAALGCCEQMILLEASHKEAWQMKGFILDALGRHEEAIAAYNAALAIKLDYHVSRSALQQRQCPECVRTKGGSDRGV